MKKAWRVGSGLMAWIGVLAWMGLAGGLGACGGDDDEVLTISPPGPVVVEKGSTQQFTANFAGVTWSVEGGDANGTINVNGLYTPPATLPIDPEVTVVASLPGAEDSALVELRTADSIAFPPATEAVQVNQDPADPSVLFETLILAGIGDRLAVNLGSIHVNAVWNGGSSEPSIFFGHSLDFGPFSPELNISPAGTSQLAAVLENDGDHNPMLALVELPPEPTATPTATPVTQVLFTRSENQGASFTAPVAVAPSTLFQGNPSMRRDENGVIHLVYGQSEELSEGVLGSIFYVQSADNGATWSSPIPVVPPPTAPAVLGFPYIAVDPEGQVLHVCFATFPDSSSLDDSFITSVKSVDGGDSFGEPVDLEATSGVADLLCRNALGSNGEVYIGWSRDVGDIAQVLFSVSTDGGSSFSSPKRISSVANSSEAFAMLSVDSLGRLDVVWTGDPTGGTDFADLIYVRSTDAGQTFSDNATLAQGVEAMVPLGLRHDVSGRTHVIFASDINDPGNSVDILYLLGE
ncbi:MAG TPA: sialidase family protein [bacterium]|nr:sialidase family protein [bacterium]